MEERITNKTVSVGTDPVVVSSELLPTQRKEIFICNTSVGGQIISLAINASPASKSGLVLYPGGSFSSSMDGYNFFPSNFQINAISDIAGGTLAVMERIGKEVLK